MPTRPRVGDVVYTLKRQEDETIKSLTIVRGRVVGENEDGLLAYKWDDETFSEGNHVHIKRVYTTIRALFRYDQAAKSFARPDAEIEQEF